MPHERRRLVLVFRCSFFVLSVFGLVYLVLFGGGIIVEVFYFVDHNFKRKKLNEQNKPKSQSLFFPLSHTQILCSLCVGEGSRKVGRLP